jgi:hypothetical protein
MRLYYVFIALFILLFILGFFVTPWLCLISFVPLVAAAVLLFKKRYIKK